MSMREKDYQLTAKQRKDIKVLCSFVSVFCRENHRAEAKETFAIKDERAQQALGTKTLLLCGDCQKLLQHGIAKLLLCPYDPKPMCKKCPAHCYAPGYRERMRQVMRFSGLYLVKHGRLDLLFHYWF